MTVSWFVSTSTRFSVHVWRTFRSGSVRLVTTPVLYRNVFSFWRVVTNENSKRMCFFESPALSTLM